MTKVGIVVLATVIAAIILISVIAYIRIIGG